MMAFSASSSWTPLAATSAIASGTTALGPATVAAPRPREDADLQQGGARQCTDRMKTFICSKGRRDGWERATATGGGSSRHLRR